jgi:protein phosphatase 1 regulatory subunit 7
LTKLRRLDIQSNRLTKIENLTTQQETLEELYLAHNGIDDDGCSWLQQTSFPKLNVLDLSKNQLTTTAPFAHLTALEELWLSSNQIATFDAILPLKESSESQKLETVYLEYNPVASEFEYRKLLAQWIPSLQQIDATLIGGLASQGMHSVAVPSTPPMQEQMRQLQEAAIERARQETNAVKEQQQEQT